MFELMQIKLYFLFLYFKHFTETLVTASKNFAYLMLNGKLFQTKAPEKKNVFKVLVLQILDTNKIVIFHPISI